ncbi:MAG: protein-disulfide isomerase [Halocynthiibacter sp.]|jgi:protein-disulfide isomerase
MTLRQILARAVAPLALAATLALPAAAFDASTMNPAEREAFGAEIRAYLLQNPEVLMEAIAVLEKRQDEAQGADDLTLVKTNFKEIFEDEGSWVGGNPDGDITIVEFMDYNCGYCKKAHPEVSKLLETDKNIRFIVKEFPILGETSVLGSRFAIATRAVAGDAAYAKVHDTLMTQRGGISDKSLDRLAKEFDLDIKAIRKEMDSDTTNAILQANSELAQRLAITGTPTFVMGDNLVRGYVPLDTMQKIVAELRAAE